jgi:YesN/AraC family two-component response regulator
MQHFFRPNTSNRLRNLWDNQHILIRNNGFHDLQQKAAATGNAAAIAVCPMIRIGMEKLVWKKAMRSVDLHDPEKLRVDYLAAHFNMSANYVGEYFRKFAGERLQHYITHYKMKLAQHRLAYSILTVSQIADEPGFRDESHLSRQFKKHTDIGPAEYRKKFSGFRSVYPVPPTRGSV